MSSKDLNDTIAAVATPVGESGIGIIRISGPESLAIADKVFKSIDGKRPSRFKTYTVHYGHIVISNRKTSKRATSDERRTTKTIDEVILTVMRRPRSFTREDTVEINCHGGVQAVRQVLQTTLKAGARLAEPGEFTKRAFLNGRIDLSQAEAVLDVIRAKTTSSLEVAMSQLEGGLSARVESIRSNLIDVAVHVEASIDFPEEDIEPGTKKSLIRKVDRSLEDINDLVDSYEEGAILKEGVLAIICGKPNVGKSSLMNLLLRRDRVIVSPVPGTTRDAVEEIISLGGIPIRLVDTAGVVETRDYLEREGVVRSRRYMSSADIALVVLDSSKALGDDDLAVIDMVKEKNKIAVINKIDLGRKIDLAKIRRIFGSKRVVEISVEKKRNIDKLEKTVGELIWQKGPSRTEMAVVSNLRHKVLLDKAAESMLSVKKALREHASPEFISVDLKSAIDDLGLITGRTVSGEILDRVFEQFCIGK